MFTKIEIQAIKVLSNKYGIPLEWTLGLAQVESAGRAFWTVDGAPLPPIREEGHYFYRNLPEGKRAVAMKRGLANPKAGKTAVPRTYAGRYDMLHEWMRLDRTAALMSISMGCGQVMGQWYDRLGFKEVDDMWSMACKSLAGQVEIMLRFIATDPRLVKAIKADKFKVVARIYNGKGYKQNKYDEKLRVAVTAFRKAATPGQIKVAATTDNTTHERQQIADLGYKTVEAFQLANGLQPDSIIGPLTREAVQNAVAQQKAAPATNAAKVAAVVATGSVLTSTLADLTQTWDTVKPILDAVKGLGANGQQIAVIAAGMIIAATTVYAVNSAMHRFNRA